MSNLKTYIVFIFLFLPFFTQGEERCLKILEITENDSLSYEFSGLSRERSKGSEFITFKSSQAISQLTKYLVEFPDEIKFEYGAFNRVGVNVTTKNGETKIVVLSSRNDEIEVNTLEEAYEKAFELVKPEDGGVEFSDLKIITFRKSWEFDVNGEHENRQIVLHPPGDSMSPFILDVLGRYKLQFYTEGEAQSYINEILSHGILLPAVTPVQRTVMLKDVEPFLVGERSAQEFHDQFGVELLTENEISREVGRTFISNQREDVKEHELLDQNFWATRSAPELVAEELISGLSRYGEVNSFDHPERRLLYANALSEKHQAQVSIRKVDDHVGYGVFAEAPLRAGDFIGEFTGHIRPGMVGQNNMYVVGLANNFYVDAQVAGNFTRFINHSVRSNATFITVFYQKRWHSILVAKKSIEKGEQILSTYDQSFNFDVTPRKLNP